MWHVWGRREINRVSVGKAEVKKEHLEELRIDGSTVLKSILKK
jgi:hypothetical protein